MVSRVIKYIALLILLSINLSAQSVSVLASVDSSDYLVGDYINYTLEIRAEKNIQIVTPFIRDSLKKVEIIKELPPQSVENDGIKSSNFVYIISFYDSASVTIPPIAIRYKVQGSDEEKIALSNPVTFSVHTVQVEQQAEIKDVKEPLTIPLDWKFILLISFIVLLILAAVYYFYRRYKKKKAEQPVKKKIIRIPAHVRALTALDNLENEKLWQKGLVKEYHSNITGIIRGYFEERFNLAALELTTSEQMQQLKKVPSAENILSITNEFLNNADLVKFAKFIPLPSVNEAMMKQAKEIVNNTITSQAVQVEEEVQNV
ncbi:MAG: hypothetical protein MUE64_03070 [Ignavibacteriaceae bacterium]|jgi:hypothetical protein|nr:hypothetical protein [Ignavibacteriaceae bacterium]MCU0405946.1 hypothetical protein [Ignavibacteriaceae bacterium]